MVSIITTINLNKYALDVSVLEYLVQTKERRYKFIRQYDNDYLHITISERSGDCR